MFDGQSRGPEFESEYERQCMQELETRVSILKERLQIFLVQVGKEYPEYNEDVLLIPTDEMRAHMRVHGYVQKLRDIVYVLEHERQEEWYVAVYPFYEELSQLRERHPLFPLLERVFNSPYDLSHAMLHATNAMRRFFSAETLSHYELVNSTVPKLYRQIEDMKKKIIQSYENSHPVLPLESLEGLAVEVTYVEGRLELITRHLVEPQVGLKVLQELGRELENTNKYSWIPSEIKQDIARMLSTSHTT